ncbi:hypothetical protein [Lactobacillus paraplantarum] [Lactiplantibacillus mudanjiangensis]|nr:hypothetical protein [Lactobacillus paraplantarum] [Lactiplantibacillus mudanjiangensis]
MIRRQTRSTLSSSSAASDVYKRQGGWSQADYDAQLKTLKGGYLGDDFPWYQTYYYYGDMNGYKKGEYSTLPEAKGCLLYTSPSPRDVEEARMPSSA